MDELARLLDRYPSDVDRFDDFRRHYCRHVEGPLALQRAPVEMEQWQYDDWRLALLLDPLTGLRLFNEVTFMRPKKHAKSLDSATLAFYCVGPWDGEGGPQGIFAAGSEKQAGVVGRVAHNMVHPDEPFHSPLLSNHFRALRGKIICKETGGLIQVISSRADDVEGAGPHFASVDEYAVHKDPELRDNIQTAMIAREQPMLFTISTVGNDMTRPLYALERDARDWPIVEQVTPYKIVCVDLEAGRLLIKYGLQEGSKADIEDPAVLKGVNVASWVTLERLVKQLKASDREASFRRKHLNQWVDTGGEGVPVALWDAAARPGIRIPDGTRVAVGIDIAYRNDWLAVVVAGRVDGEIVFEHHLVKPPDAADEEIDVAGTLDDIVLGDIAKRLQMTKIRFDPAKAVETWQRWVQRGLPVEEFYQYDSKMGPASARFLSELKRGSLRHDGDRTYRWHVLNAIIKELSGDRFRYDKPRDETLKIDGLIATLMACDALLTEPPPSTLPAGGLIAL